ncbi:MAG: alpha-2-macroglobulin [Thermodesulfobacteriota bacterium]
MGNRLVSSGRLISVILMIVMATAAWAGQEQSQPANKFRVLDIGERTYDQGPAIAVVFSHPLDPKKRYDDFLQISDPKEILKSAWVLSEDGRVLYFPHVEPQIEYSVTVLENLPAADGQALEERTFKALTTRKVTPGVSFASDGLILPQKMTEGLPLAVINVKSVEIEFFRLNESGVINFVNWENITGRQSYEEIQKVKKFGEFVYSGRFDLDPPRNRRAIRHVQVTRIEALQKPGVYFAVLRQPGEYDYDYQATYFLITDIGLHARVYAFEALILASSLTTGQPLAGVNLTFYNKKVKPVASGVTDQDGRFTLAENFHRKEIAYVQAGLEGHLAVLPFDLPALDLSDFELDGRRQQPREVFVYSPRDLYRPGETVVLSALLRDYDGRPVKALPLAAALFRPDGRRARSFTWHPEAGPAAGQGYYQTELTLPGDAQTGKWRLELRETPTALPFRTFSFSVEDFMPERMKLDLASPRDYLTPEEDWEIDAAGLYLYGAPAAGNKLDGKVRVRAKRDLMEKLEGYQFGEIGDQGYSDHWDLDETELDQKGRAVLLIENKWRDVRSPLSVRVTASLYETGGRPVSRGLERTVWPAEALVGLRPLFTGDYLEPGAVNFEVVKVKPDGALVQAQGLLVTVTKEERDYYWEYSEAKGWEQKHTDKKYVYLTDTLNLDGVKPAGYSVTLNHGRYVLEIKDPATNLAASLRFSVGFRWYRYEQREAARPDKVKLELDKPMYQPGDVARLTVTPPHSGEARILVEGDKPLWFKRVEVSAKGTVVEIPISAAWDSHDLYLSAVVFRSGQAKEKITPNRAIGVIHLPLDRSRRNLALEIEAPEKVSPQGPTPLTARLKLGVRPKGPVLVTLAAVDVGILSITDFETPDPAAWFFEKRRYGVDQHDLYGKVVELMDGTPATLKYGGDADVAAGGKAPETKVKLVSLFQSPVAFDDQGRAEVTLTLPGDFNGRLRLMAVAFGGEAFGSAEREVTVAAPIVAQLATPRYLAPGDTTEFALDLHNLSGQDQDLKIELTATPPLALSDGRRIVKLKDKEKTTLRFPVKARPDFQASRIELRLSGQGVKLEGDWQLGVKPGYPATARKVRRILKNGEAFVLDRNLAADLLPASVEADLKVSPVIPFNLKRVVSDLIAYPYGCLEQTTSRAFPLLYATPDNAERFGLLRLDSQIRLARLDGAIERISLMHLPRGGFGLWNERSPEEPWLTCYAGDFLLQARDQGLNVPAGLMDQALKRLEFYVQRPWPKEGTKASRDELDFTVRCYAAYLLAKVNRAPLGTLRTMYDNHRNLAVSSLPLTHLGLALKLMGDNLRSDQAFKAAAQKRRSDRWFWGDYGSPLRDLALTLALLLEHKIESPGLEKLTFDLDEELRQRRWLSTQEKYAAFKVGLAVETAADKEWSGRLRQAGRETAVKQRKALLLSPSVKEMGAGVVFRSEHQRPLYVSAVVSGYPIKPPAKDDSIVVLERELYDLKGKKIVKREFKVGDLMLVHLLVNSKESVPDALVVDLLPAGFEIENPNFKYSLKLDDAGLEDLAFDGRKLQRIKEGTPFQHEEFKDDRYVAVLPVEKGRNYHLFYLVRAVSPGTFTVPPVFLESMYRPEIRGLGETPLPITVVNKTK